MEQKQRKEDKRVVRTKRSVRNALAQLLVEKDVENISIKEIAEMANVDRKTVYNYYKTIYEILSELENAWIEDFDNFTRRLENERGDDYFHLFFPALTELIAGDIDLYTQLMRMGSQSRIIRRWIDFLSKKLRKAFARTYEITEEKLNVAAEFVLSGLFWSYRSWFNSDRKKTLAEFSTELGQLVMGGLTAYFA